MASNFLQDFINSHGLHIVDFMKIWYHYDTDKNGFIEKSELRNFVKDFSRSKKTGGKMSEAEIDKACQEFLAEFDKNKDGKIELFELQKIIPKEQNFLLQFQEDLTEDTFEKVFKHYDKDGNGVIEGPELIGLLRDLREHASDSDEGYVVPTSKELEDYRDMILGLSDEDKDGKLQKHEIKMLFLG